MNEVVYVDNNATTQVALEVFDVMKGFLTEKYGNPSSMHQFGGRLRKNIDEARKNTADLIGASEAEEIIFTSCGTESDNAAIFSALRSSPEKKHIITTEVEHPAVLNLCKYLENNGYSLTYLRVNDSGELDLQELKESICEDTALISVMYANNETGVIFPIEEIGEIAREHDILFHTDAVQFVGKDHLDLKRLPVDMLSLSGHKLHAAKGVGALYIRKGTEFSPFLIGGHQEFNRRGGTENIASIAGLGVACLMAKKNLRKDRAFIKGLRDRLEEGLLKKIPNARVNGCVGKRLPNTTNIGFEFVEGEAILLLADKYGIAASSGSACTSGSLSPSHVLKAMKVPFTFMQGSVRFSLSRYNTEEDVDHILKTFPLIIEKLRKISPYGKDRKKF